MRKTKEAALSSATREQAPQTQNPLAPQHHELFRYEPPLHRPRNINLIQKAEKAAGGFNQRVAVGLTNIFQAMSTFWLMLTWILIWILGNCTFWHFDPLPWPLLLCLTSVPQLPLMVVIMVGQGLLGRKQELQAEEAFSITMSNAYDIEQVKLHLSAQDAQLLTQHTLLLRHTCMLEHLLEKHGVELLEQEPL